MHKDQFIKITKIKDKTDNCLRMRKYNNLQPRPNYSI